mmetsp:Transcript_51527/g.137506  ORF Transcript_51527/g.137506 Transcript_51527/m.137506 type:complete len:197 (-) Transcript_51527:219-809(-)
MQPRSRSERHGLKGKDAVEKARLRNRSGGFFRYEDVRNPIDVSKGCPSHLDGKPRMVAGARCEEISLAERERAKAIRDEVTESRRARDYNREESRWRAISAQETAQEERAKRLVDDPLIGRKNVTGHPFNIVTHEYDTSMAGLQLKHRDEMVRYRGKVRGAALATRNHMGFNPIIGEQTFGISLPPPPRPPLMPLG